MKLGSALPFLFALTFAALPLYAQEDVPGDANPPEAAAPEAVPPAPSVEADIPYSSEQRFRVPVDKSNGLKGATNVVLKEVTYDVLPDAVAAQADLIAKTCTSNERNVRSIKFYRYMSDLSRDNQLPPNYLFDLGAFANKKLNNCACLAPMGNATSWVTLPRVTTSGTCTSWCVTPVGPIPR
jgi:hypothetical protein